MGFLKKIIFITSRTSLSFFILILVPRQTRDVVARICGGDVCMLEVIFATSHGVIQAENHILFDFES